MQLHLMLFFAKQLELGRIVVALLESMGVAVVLAVHSYFGLQLELELGRTVVAAAQF
jgi:hypothetical protein